MKTTRAKLLIFSRYPVPGKAKTRLIGQLTPLQAAQLQRQMTSYTVDTARKARAVQNLTVELRCEGAPLVDFKQWLGDDIQFQPQGSGDLGQRIARAVKESFEDGFKPVMVIGADCPWLTEVHITTAIDQLKRHDMVIGPAEDGGYYLIGLNTQSDQLFAGIPWGGHLVLDKSMEQARSLGLEVGILEMLSDVDRPEDLIRLPKQFKLD